MAANKIKASPVFPETMQSNYMKLWVTIASSTITHWHSVDSNKVLWVRETDVCFVYDPSTNTAYVKLWLWRKFTNLGAREADIIDWLTPRMKATFGCLKTLPINLMP